MNTELEDLKITCGILIINLGLKDASVEIINALAYMFYKGYYFNKPNNEVPLILRINSECGRMDRMIRYPNTIKEGI
jgi:hypothetical protein